MFHVNNLPIPVETLPLLVWFVSSPEVMFTIPFTLPTDAVLILVTMVPILVVSLLVASRPGRNLRNMVIRVSLLVVKLGWPRLAKTVVELAFRPVSPETTPSMLVLGSLATLGFVAPVLTTHPPVPCSVFRCMALPVPTVLTTFPETRRLSDTKPSPPNKHINYSLPRPSRKLSMLCTSWLCRMLSLTDLNGNFTMNALFVLSVMFVAWLPLMQCTIEKVFVLVGCRVLGDLIWQWLGWHLPIQWHLLCENLGREAIICICLCRVVWLLLQAQRSILLVNSWLLLEVLLFA